MNLLKNEKWNEEDVDDDYKFTDPQTKLQL